MMSARVWDVRECHLATVVDSGDTTTVVELMLAAMILDSSLPARVFPVKVSVHPELPPTEMSTEVAVTSNPNSKENLPSEVVVPD